MPREPSSKQRILKYFLDNPGVVLRSQAIQEASGGAVEWARRVRELREVGWQIQTNNDRSDLRPGEYVLAEPTPPPYVLSRSLSNRTRAQVLERNGYTCQMCGAGASDVDDNGRPVRLHIGHIVDRSHGGSDELSNLRALCSACNQGAKNLTQEPPSHTWLLSQVRRATADDQRTVLEWLRSKFQEEL